MQKKSEIGQSLRDHLLPSDTFLNTKSKKKRLISPLLLTLLGFCTPLSLSSTEYIVSNLSDSDASGTLRAAINSANRDEGPSTIRFATNGTIKLQSSLPIITASHVSILGNNKTVLSGQNNFQAFVVYPASSNNSFILENLSLTQMNSQGGNGGNGSGGGGGSLGAGGGLFVAPGTNISLSGVSFENCKAIGGAGGLSIDGKSTYPLTATGGGGGGSLAKHGEHASSTLGDGGKGGIGTHGGVGAGPELRGNLITGDGKDGASPFSGGGGGGGTSMLLAGGNGGTGGHYAAGGGGGSGLSDSILISGKGGDGGFGAGGGGEGQGSTFGPGLGGFGAEDGGSGKNRTGGAGAALGGAFFIDGGGKQQTVSLTDIHFDNNAVSGNAKTLGKDIFITSGVHLELNLSSEKTIQEIGGDEGAAYKTTGGGLTLKGAGTLNLPGNNTYSGSSKVRGPATLAIQSDKSLGSTSFDVGDVHLIDGGTLKILTSDVTSRPFTLVENGTVFADKNVSYTISGPISGPGRLNVTGPGRIILDHANTYEKGTSITNGTTLSIASDAALGRKGANLTFEDGLSTLELAASFASNRPLILNGTAHLKGESGTNTFTQTISGPGSLIWNGPNTLALKGENSYAGGTTLDGGVLAVEGVKPLGTGVLNHNEGTLSFVKNTVLKNDISFQEGSSHLLAATSGTHSRLEGSLVGKGGVTFAGPGSISLLGSNSYTGGTVLKGATIETSGNNPFGPGVIKFESGALFLVDNGSFNNALQLSSPLFISTAKGATTTFSGEFTGPGHLMIAGEGKVLLTGDNSTYASGFHLNGGTLLTSESKNLGTGDLKFHGGKFEPLNSAVYVSGMHVTETGGTVVLSEGITGTFKGKLSGNGILSLEKTGSLVLLGDQTSFKGKIAANEATLVSSSSQNLGTAPLSFNGGTLSLKSADVYSNNLTIGSRGLTLIGSIGKNTFTGSFQGIGGIDISSDGTFAFTGTNTYAEGTRIQKGILEVQAAHNLGTGTVTFSGGHLSITGSSHYDQPLVFVANPTRISVAEGTNNTFAASISGPGGFTKLGEGVLTLSGSNSYGGGTTLSEGTLRVQGMNPLGTGTLTLNGGTLDVGEGFYSNPFLLANQEIFTIHAPATFAGPLWGGKAAGLTKLGAGTLTLSGNNTYLGETVVAQGKLIVDGALASSGITVNSGAVFGGSGSVGSILVQGTLAPGSSPGILNAQTVVFEKGSSFQPLLQGDASSSLQVAGNVKINSGTKLSPDLNPQLAARYQMIKSAGTISGRFVPTGSGTPRYPVYVDYSPHEVVLRIEAVPFATLVPNDVQNIINIATCFDQASTIPSTDMTAVLDVLNGLSVVELVGAFNQFDPGFYNSVSYAGEAVSERVRKVYSSHAYERDYDPCFMGGLWGSLFAERDQQDKAGLGAAGSGYDQRFGGFVAGIDGFVTCDALATAGFGYARSRVNWNEIEARTVLSSYTGFLATTVYGLPYSVDAYVSYTYNKFDGNRHIFILPSPASVSQTPIDRVVDHSGDSHTYLAHLGGTGRTPFRGSNFYAISFANLDYLFVHENPIDETGGGVLNLDVRGKNSDLLRPEIGLGIGFLGELFSDEKVYGDVDVSYVREFRFAGESTSANFQGSGCTFTVFGLLPRQGLVCPSARLGISSSYGFDVALNYNGAFGKHFSGNAATVELTLLF